LAQTTLVSSNLFIYSFKKKEGVSQQAKKPLGTSEKSWVNSMISHENIFQLRNLLNNKNPFTKE